MNSPRFLAQAWESRVVYARDVYTSLWREVSRYGGQDAADRVMVHANADSRNLARFRNAVSLADDFWVAYESALESIDVVPLYYGSLNLGNAISYCTLSNARVNETTTSHGLTLNNDFSRANAVLNTTILFGRVDDTFGMINEALGGDDFCGTSCTLLDLLRMLPDLSDRLEHFAKPLTYEVTFTPGGRIQSAAGGAVEIIGKVRLQNGIRINAGFVRDNFAISGYLADANLQIENDDIRWVTKRLPLTEFENLAISANGSRWLLPKLHQKTLPEYGIYLAGLYVLSVFARYIPDYWLKIQDEHGDEWTLIRDFVALAEEKVPLLALNHFARAIHRFELRS